MTTLQQKEVTITIQHEELQALILILIMLIMVYDGGSTLTDDVSAKSALEMMSRYH